MPNNGTLRLPLDPIGVHKSPDTGLETPPDPVDATSSPAPASSVTSITESTKPILVNPISTTTPAATTSTSSSKSVAVDLPGPSPTEEPGNGDEDEDDGDVVHNFWDWLTGKIDQLWDKITSSEKGPA